MPRLFSFARQRRFLVSCLLVVVFATAKSATATTVDYFSSYGTVVNDSTSVATGGECVAASFINGMTYLKSHYSSIYSGTTITTGATTSSTAAMHEFGSYGWTSNGTTYSGYYARCNSVYVASGSTTYNSFGNWWQTTIDWMENSFAAGKTTFSAQAATSLSGESTSSWTYSSNVSSTAPTYSFLNSAVNADDYVEIAVYGYVASENGYAGHALNLLNIIKSGSNYTVIFQDPNNPTVEYTSTATLNNFFGVSCLSFYDTYTFGATYPVYLVAAFALAAVPEPGTIVLLGVAFVGFVGWTWRRHRRAA